MSFKKVKLYSAALILSSSLPTTLFAGAMGEVAPYFKGHFLAQLGGYGAVHGTPERQEYGANRYTVQSHNTGSGLVGVGYMFDGPAFFDKRFSLSYGIDTFFLGQTTVNGYIIQKNQASNLSYSYKIQNIPLYFMLQSLINTGSEQWKLVFDGGIGPNFMNLSGYREVSLNTTSLSYNASRGSDPTTFAATAGVALRFSYAAEKLPLECGYRFFYLGNGRLDANSYSIKTGDNYANALVCSVLI